MNHRRKRPRTSSRGHNWSKAEKKWNETPFKFYSKVPSHYSLLTEKRPQHRYNKRIMRKIKYNLSVADAVVFNDKKSEYYW